MLSTIMMHTKIIMQEQLYACVKEKPTGIYIRINDFKGLCETLMRSGKTEEQVKCIFQVQAEK